MTGIMKLRLKDVKMHHLKKRDIRNMNRKPHHHKHKKHKKSRGKHRKRKKHIHNPAGSTSREYRKIEHKNQKFRRKRASMDDPDLDSCNSGYEKSDIYIPDISEAERYRYSLEKGRRYVNDGYTENQENIESNITEKYSGKKKKQVIKANVPQKHKSSHQIIQDLKQMNLRNFDKRTINEGNLTRPEISKKSNKVKEKISKALLPVKGKNKVKDEVKKLLKKEKASTRKKRKQKNKGCYSSTIVSGKLNKKTDENANSSNSNGLLAMELKIIEILPLGSNCSNFKHDEENVIVEDEVRKLEEKTNVYPDITESMETNCFKPNEEASMTSHCLTSDEKDSTNFNHLNYMESNPNFSESSTKTGKANKQKIINFDDIDKQLKDENLEDPEGNRKIANSSRKEN